MDKLIIPEFVLKNKEVNPRWKKFEEDYSFDFLAPFNSCKSPVSMAKKAKIPNPSASTLFPVINHGKLNKRDIIPIVKLSLEESLNNKTDAINKTINIV